MEITYTIKPDSDQVIKNLRGILSLEDYELLQKGTSRLQYSSDEPIIRQGGFVSQVLFLEKGLVKVMLEGLSSRNTIIKVVEQGEFVALPALGNTDRYPFSITAVTSCQVCLINKDCLTKISERSPSFNKFLLNWYAKDYLFMYDKIATISTRNSHGKVASTLLYLSNSSFKLHTLSLLSRKDLAELSSVSVESLNKILQQLRSDGIIEIIKTEIVIKRRDVLEKISNVG